MLAVRAHVDDDVVIAIGKQVPPNAQGECVGLYSIRVIWRGTVRFVSEFAGARLLPRRLPRHWWTTTD